MVKRISKLIATDPLKLFPETVVALVSVITGGLGTCSAFTFVAGMMSKKTNAKGLSLES